MPFTATEVDTGMIRLSGVSQRKTNIIRYHSCEDSKTVIPKNLLQIRNRVYGHTTLTRLISDLRRNRLTNMEDKGVMVTKGETREWKGGIS